MHLGIAADHGGFELKSNLIDELQSQGHTLIDFGAAHFDSTDDYPDFIIPLARAVAAGTIERGIAICGSGVGASVVANKIPGVRAALVHDSFSAHQGVEDDALNLMCLGARVIGQSLAVELVGIFLHACVSNADRHLRRLDKVTNLEKNTETLAKGGNP
jgi:ribose 5-phosphate isomerase B